MKMELRIKTCCFTGHREIPAGFEAELKERTKRVILELLPSGIRFFGTGGARGYDAIAAESVLEIREIHPEVRLILVLPCRDQTRNWRLEDV